jgi:hypothetical protein
MRTLTLAFICIFTFSTVFAQTKIKGDTLFLSNGLEFAIGQDLHFGLGSNMATRDFNYIYTSPLNAFAPAYKLGSAWANRQMRIKDFKRTYTKRTGEKYYIILGGGNIVPYWCEIEPALQAKEVIVNGFNDKDAATNLTPVSVADELSKLKKLYDDSVLTKEEYEAQKKKLLDQH